MRKVLGVLFTVVPLVLSLAIQGSFASLSNILTLEKSSFELSGQVKEVVMGLKGNGYVTVTSEGTDVRIPLSFANPTAVKVGSSISVKGTKTTFVVPIYIETSGYRIQLRLKPIRDTLEYVTLSFKIKKIEISKTDATLILADDKGKEIKLPAQVIPVWRNLKVGDDFKITGVKRTSIVPESIVIDGVKYKFSQQPLDGFQKAIMFQSPFGGHMIRGFRRFK
ncbi:MAG: hypothetical protein N2Z58_01265 [Fervidobacterium sp.]|nr:hypothetical protein [Fervidobacterium sp.]